jgi:site-specific recombinase XerD
MSPGSELLRWGTAESSLPLLIASVVDTLTAAKTKQAYRAALQEFFAWTAACGEPLSQPLLASWRGALLARGLSVSSVNQRLSAVRSRAKTRFG